MRPEIVVVGAGPTGLGAAWRLRELGHESWRLVEAGPTEKLFTEPDDKLTYDYVTGGFG